MQNITIGRYDKDPEAQGVIEPADKSWQLVLDKDGFPHLYIRCQIEDIGDGKPGCGMICVEHFMQPETSIRDLMQSVFSGKLTPDEEKAAAVEFVDYNERHGIPCPRM